MIRIYYNTIRHNTLYKSNKFDIKFFKPNLKKLKYAFISYFQPLCEIFIFYTSNKVRFFYPNVLNSREKSNRNKHTNRLYAHPWKSAIL